MEGDSKVITHLILVLGFSRRNAEIVLEKFRRGELTHMEEEVINYVQLYPYRDSYPAHWYLGDESRVRAMERLNYRITQEGGVATQEGKYAR